MDLHWKLGSLREIGEQLERLQEVAGVSRSDDSHRKLNRPTGRDNERKLAHGDTLTTALCAYECYRAQCEIPQFQLKLNFLISDDCPQVDSGGAQQ